jgi:DNA polymerase sigma
VTYWLTQIDLDEKERDMECCTQADHHNCSDTCCALGHEAKVCHQQTELEAKNTGYVAAKLVSESLQNGS